MATAGQVLADGAISVLDHGFVRLDDAMASDLSVVNGARVSFARRKKAMDEADEGLIRFLMRDRHGTPFEHNAFRFHIRCPIFVAREWFRHRVGCLAGETEVTFVNANGVTGPRLRKTVEELWNAWERGERDGHAPSADVGAQIEGLTAAGRSMRSVARELSIGRRAVASHLAGKRDRRDGRWRVRKMRLRVLNESSGEFEVGHISDVVDKGAQPVYRLSLADGKQITVTESHQLLTSDGWATMRVALGLVGNGSPARMTRKCSLMVNGLPVHQDRTWLAERRERGNSVAEIADEAGCSYHTVRKWLSLHDLKFSPGERYHSGRRPWNAGLSGYRLGRTTTEAHRQAIRRARSGAKSNFWRGGISSNRASIGRWTREQAPRVHAHFDFTCQVCGTRGGRLHAHHIVPVWLDLERALDSSNLISLCDTCHRAVHRTRQAEIDFASRLAVAVPAALDAPRRNKGWRLTAHAVEVVDASYLGLRRTFDLCVEGPWHNFVANGIVVHNSFNEFSMRYARPTDEFYVPEADDVRTQVGKPGAYSFNPVSDEVAQTTRETLQDVYESAYAAYERLVELGVARELARSVMPVGAYTEFYWTVNARSLMNFLSLRAAETAQREIRLYAEACERFFAERMPVTHGAFAANGRVAP